MKSVRFSQHALEKFQILERHGFEISEEAIIATVRSPDKVEYDKNPPIAQRRISQNTVLRVVYTEEEDSYFVVTFYPGGRKRYED